MFNKRRVFLGIALIVAGFLLQNYASEIASCQQTSSLSDFCKFWLNEFVQSGISGIGTILLSIGIVYVFLFDIIVSVLKKPVREAVESVIDKTKIALEMSEDADLDAQQHRELFINHACLSTKNEIPLIRDFVNFIYDSTVNPASDGQIYWKYNLNVSISVKTLTFTDEYFAIVENTSFTIISLSEGESYNNPIESEYFIPDHSIDKFVEQLKFEFSVGEYSFKFGCDNAQEICNALKRDSVYTFDNCKISYNNDHLKICLEHDFPLKKGENQVSITDTGFIHKSDRFYTYQSISPCKDVSFTIDLPDSIFIFESSYSHLVYYKEGESRSPAISQNRHYFRTDGFVFPGILFSVYWENDQSTPSK